MKKIRYIGAYQEERNETFIIGFDKQKRLVWMSLEYKDNWDYLIQEKNKLRTDEKLRYWNFK